MHYGFDIGGTKISFAVFDQQFHQIAYQRLATPSRFSDLLDLIEGLVNQHDSQYGQRGTIGIGAPGCTDGEHWYAANAPAVNQQPFKQQLQLRIKRPLVVTNDANCFGIAEAVAIAPEHNKTIFAVILGTGVGGSLIVNGHLIEGKHGLTGEWGHQPLPLLGCSAAVKQLNLPELNCNCGRIGCIDTYISGTGLQNLASFFTGQTLSAEAVVAAWQQGDSAATQVVECYIECLAASLAMIINFIDPDTIILGGGLSQVAEFYPAVIANWQKYTLISNPSTQLQASQFGADSGVRGAAYLGSRL
ncbi:ROK family protein [Spartinivicinus poritis]|uniref:ROK family protein n=1 Tax=Spartinivicinus poritis TaxID=2994640 RepID=A0ABT5UHX1_9GAMM|nr:ROK family protein [Spartinivicinus sp. A2-2]MDE1465117.1 ROK family protein [Spartinivicinus sp. A2-2]